MMHLTMNLLCLLVLTFHPDLAMGGRSQRRQRQAEDSLRPYLGRVDPVQLCELLKCHSPMGSWCQVVQDNGVLVPKFPKSNCTEEEYGQFPYRLMDWFLLLSRMGESYAPYAPPQSCLSHAQRTQLAQRRFALLDKNKDGKLSRRDLRKLRYKRMPLEQCATFFFHRKAGVFPVCSDRSCDRNKNSKVTLHEWISCLVDRSESWFYSFMSMKMGSGKLCPMKTDNHL
ncbi:unnamed protein product [Coregonus sp. 'balchen']|nr:unnamed protein product [Coregonus sp. 'balchen']